MSGLIEELRQLALMAANDVQWFNKADSDLVSAAYDRVKSLDSIVCPKCLVDEGRTVDLKIEAYALDTNLYVCRKCKFKAVLPKVDAVT